MEWICGMGFGAGVVVAFLYWSASSARTAPQNVVAMRVLLTNFLAKREAYDHLARQMDALTGTGMADDEVAHILRVQWGDPTIDAQLVGVARTYSGGALALVDATHRQFRRAMYALDSGDAATALLILESVERENNLRAAML
jgi:hypothetical protein